MEVNPELFTSINCTDFVLRLKGKNKIRGSDDEGIRNNIVTQIGPKDRGRTGCRLLSRLGQLWKMEV